MKKISIYFLCTCFSIMFLNELSFGSEYFYKNYESSITTQSDNLIGIYLTNTSGFSSISHFEEKTTYHHLYGFEMTANEKPPIPEIIECYIYSKTPLITIYTDQKTKPSYSEMLNLVLDLNSVDVPIIVNLFPFSSNNWSNFQEYKDYWEDTSKTFERLAPNVTVVWSAYYSDVPFIKSFMPNEETFEYMGLMYYGAGKEGSDEFFNSLNYIYNLTDKNIFITSLGISHYSTKDNAYKEEETIATLNEIYTKIGKNYDKVKAIIYMDKDLGSFVPHSVICNNYEVTSTNKLLLNYTRIVTAFKNNNNL